MTSRVKPLSTPSRLSSTPVTDAPIPASSTLTRKLTVGMQDVWEDALLHVTLHALRLVSVVVLTMLHKRVTHSRLVRVVDVVVDVH